MESRVDEHLGETFISHEGCTFYIVDYVNCSDVTVKFADEHGAEIRTSYKNCQNGYVKNPFFPSVVGVGCLGVGDFKTKVNGKPTREYNLWKHMLNRCYSKKYQQKNPSYINVTVCDRWLVYANFIEDLPKIENYELWMNSPNQHISLDKDLKQQGVQNKVYSLETCKFVTQSENSKEANERTKRKKVICLETKQVFRCTKDASKWCGGNVSMCCRGVQKSAGGCHWMWYDDYKRQLRLNIDIKNSQLQI